MNGTGNSGPKPQDSPADGFVVAHNLQLAFRFRDREPNVVLDGVSFEVGLHEVIAIVGPNGCGKTTLLMALAGLQSLDQGSITIGNKLSQEASVGVVFQNYRESLLPWRTVEDNIAFSLEIAGVKRSERRTSVRDFVRRLDSDIPVNRYPYQLSGGQQQTASILRALIASPELLLLDEPFASLDYRARLHMHENVQEIFSTTGQTVVLVSHEIDEAILLSDRVLVMSHRPARILASVPVGLPKPRSKEVVLTEDFLQIKSEIFRHFPL